MIRTLIAIVAVIMLAGAAQADSGFHMGISAGQARGELPGGFKDTVRGWAREARDEGAAASTRFSESDAVHKVWLGYRFNSVLAVEAGYAKLGRLAGGIDASDDEIAVRERYRAEHKALFLDLVGTVALAQRWNLIARGGVARVRTKGSFGASVEAEQFRASARIWERFRETVPKLGLGVEYVLDHGLAVRAEFERYFDVGDDSRVPGFESDIDVLSVGLNYRF
ncbi:outer membrane beta-barrel protein [Pseudazoarcus pumilus]|uniref:Outer membrane protein OmpA-like transmembrane domain-containing protein n=1 Tax=Pseudazoarcus pumilus TaxID=2067960 RepID=A0A2I6S520_9RHOO|nr:outer membrane beta-barrel protein [Pseudazoarcus pumilus]AUN94345.1 hypothetical protein C0099_04965 [Pseudazoarcus pumilus]